MSLYWKYNLWCEMASPWKTPISLGSEMRVSVAHTDRVYTLHLRSIAVAGTRGVRLIILRFVVLYNVKKEIHYQKNIMRGHDEKIYSKYHAKSAIHAMQILWVWMHQQIKLLQLRRICLAIKSYKHFFEWIWGFFKSKEG